MGSKRKQLRLQDEIEHTERRRSNRIISLEEKKQQEKERKLALSLEKNKGKEKATTDDEGNCLDDFNELGEKDGPTKKARKSKELQQLLSLIKEGQCPETAINSRTNASSQNSMPRKEVLEFTLDILQRKDPDELFAEPVNPDTVKNYYEIVKQPMDFGTMRAKLHEGMYTSLEQFKRDVYLIYSNAMNVHPATSSYYQVAEVINDQAKSVFEILLADPEQLSLELSLNKKCTTKRAKDKQRSSRRERVKDPKLAGSNNSVMSEINRRNTYLLPRNKSLVAEILNSKKSSIPFIKDPINYKDSLLKFVKDLGPTAQRVAAKKLEVLKNQQLCNSDTPQPQEPTQPVSFNAKPLFSHTFPSFNRPLTIPGTSSAAQESRNVNRDINANKGKKTYTNENWNASSVALLSSYFLNKSKGGGRGTNAIGGTLQEGTNNQIQHRMFEVNPIGSSSNVYSRVYPTLVISGAESKPLDFMSHNSLTRSQEQTQLSLVSQPRPEDSISTMSSNNLTGLTFLSQPKQENSIQFNASTQYQPRYFQGIMGSPEFNNKTYPVQQSDDDMQMQLIAQLNPLNEPEPSSNLEVPLGGAVNFFGEGDDPIARPTTQLLWDEQQFNLALQL